MLYDNNGISIDGKTSLSDSVDQVMRFESAGWNASRIDGHDAEAILNAVRAAQNSDRPTMIACKTTIGFGLPTKAGTNKAHGEAPGAAEVAGARKNLNWPYDPFVVPDDILAAWRKAGARGKPQNDAWRARLAGLAPERRAEFERRTRGELPKDLDFVVDAYKRKLAADAPEIATRKAGEAALNVIAPAAPELVTRFRGSDPLQQHQGCGDPRDYAGELLRSLHPLGHPRARHGGGLQRDRGSWRAYSVGRVLPLFHRLLPAFAAARRVDEDPRRACVHP